MDCSNERFSMITSCNPRAECELYKFIDFNSLLIDTIKHLSKLLQIVNIEFDVQPHIKHLIFSMSYSVIFDFSSLSLSQRHTKITSRI